MPKSMYISFHISTITNLHTSSLYPIPSVSGWLMAVFSHCGKVKIFVRIARNTLFL